MFGFGPLEIAALVGLLVFLFGAPRAGRLLGNAWRILRRVDEVKGQLRAPFSLKSWLLRRGRMSGE